MLRLSLEFARTWVLIALLLWVFWLVSVNPAQALRPLKALELDQIGHSIELMTVYETSYDAQKGVVKSLKIPNKGMKKAAGFQGASMLQSQNGKEVISLSQWQDLASYQAYNAPASANAGSLSPTSTPLQPSRTLLFQTEAAQTSVFGAIPALRGKQAVVQLVHFTPKNAGTQPQILTQLERMLPNLLQQQPIPQSVMVLKGIENDAIALMVNWNCSAAFEGVGQPGDVAIAPDLATLADYTQQIYNVANIISAEPEETGE